MDYCSTCRRTLNGVFVCPGCGAYAPDIAPAGSHLHHTPSTVAVMAEISHTREYDAFPGYHDPAFVDAAFIDPDVDAPVGPATPSATGRAARRRRLADWKKQRRRAVVASTVALVGGGLTLAFMPSSRPSASQAQASSLPDPSTAPSTSSAGSVDAGQEESETNRPNTRTPQHSESGNGGSKAPKGDNSPGSATAITPVDSPAKRKTPPPSTPDESRPTADTQPETRPESPATPDTPPVAEDPTPQPNKPTEPAPAPPPPSAEPPKESNPGLCVLVLCLDLDGNN